MSRFSAGELPFADKESTRRASLLRPKSFSETSTLFNNEEPSPRSATQKAARRSSFKRLNSQSPKAQSPKAQSPEAQSPKAQSPKAGSATARARRNSFNRRNSGSTTATETESATQKAARRSSFNRIKVGKRSSIVKMSSNAEDIDPLTGAYIPSKPSIKGLVGETLSLEDRMKNAAIERKRSQQSTEYRDIKCGRNTFRLTPGCDVYTVVSDFLEANGDLDPHTLEVNMSRLEKHLDREAATLPPWQKELLKSLGRGGFYTGRKTSRKPSAVPKATGRSDGNGHGSLQRKRAPPPPPPPPGTAATDRAPSSFASSKRLPSRTRADAAGAGAVGAGAAGALETLTLRVRRDVYELKPGMNLPKYFTNLLTREGRVEELAPTLASIKRQLEKNATARPEWQWKLLKQL